MRPTTLVVILSQALAASCAMAFPNMHTAINGRLVPQARRQMQQSNGTCVMPEGFSVYRNTRVKPEAVQTECTAAASAAATCIPCVCSLYAIFFPVSSSEEWQTDPRAFKGDDEQQRALLEETGVACVEVYSQAFLGRDQLVAGINNCMNINTITDNKLPIRNIDTMIGTCLGFFNLDYITDLAALTPASGGNTTAPLSPTPSQSVLSPPAARSVTGTAPSVNTPNLAVTSSPSLPAASAPRGASASMSAVGLLHMATVVLSMLFLCQHML